MYYDTDNQWKAAYNNASLVIKKNLIFNNLNKFSRLAMIENAF